MRRLFLAHGFGGAHFVDGGGFGLFRGRGPGGRLGGVGRDGLLREGGRERVSFGWLVSV